MSFDLLAPHYRWMELVLAGEKLQRCRTLFLPEVRDADNVLILGEGNGRFLVECRKLLAGARITCVDASARMLELARHRLEDCDLRLEGVEFVHADALSWKAPQKAFDLIVTHFFLDCFPGEDLTKLLCHLAEACHPGARWLLADFQIPKRGISRLRAQLIHRLMYLFFRIATRLPARRLTPPDPLLELRGFVLRRRQLSDWGLLRSDLWEQVKGRGPGA
jgi:ubiquinone/menaquinone biosynthesis C-methylase UbiE